MRLAYYAGASTAAAAACLLKAFHERPNFYSATVYLSQSNACLLILTNLLLVLACSFMYALQRLLYGPLRPIEVEQLSEKAWYAVLDTLLAMPSFRDDVGGWLLVMFTLLLAGKIWGWIGEGKVDVLEQQPPANPRLFHARLATSLIVSLSFDTWMLNYCVSTVFADPRPGMMVIFTFEFAILTISSAFTFARYGLSVLQARIEGLQMKKAIDDRKNEIRAERAAARQNETVDGQAAPASPPNEEPIEVDENEVDVPGWEDKRRYLFFLEVFTDFVKLMIYIIFFTVSITFNGLPMHIMRDVYMTFASFSKRVSDYMAYRKATSDMNARYPDATTEEIRGDACIVCREGMVAWEQPNAQAGAQPAPQQPDAAPAPTRRRDEGLRAKKLPCGHILHLRCLKAWLERQQVCPTCRRPVVAPRDSRAQGQPGGAVAGQNPAALGQQAPQQGQRQGRARILNFGPIRIGFLNGPGDQIGNLVRQMQNPQAAARQDGAQDAAQQGPNHLGLPVPYLAGQQPPEATPAQSNQLQILQMQQRIMQEAQNLAVEQQQLNLLRGMENELSRLRALQQPALQATNSNAASQPLLPIGAAPLGHIPLQPTMPLQHPYAPYSSTPLHGNRSEEVSDGDANLPPGLILPEGWTLMPLHRADGTNTLPTSAQPANAHSTSVVQQQAGSVRQSQSTLDSTSNGVQSAVGPTDDDGSPLFVPTVPATDGSATGTASDQNAELTAHENGAKTAEAQNERRSAETWGFGDLPNGQTNHGGQNGETSVADDPANGDPPQSEERSYAGKGKAKAAEVEDAPDPGT